MQHRLLPVKLDNDWGGVALVESSLDLFANFVGDERGGNGDVILERGDLRAVLRDRHGQQPLILVVRHNDGLGARLLCIVCLRGGSCSAKNDCMVLRSSM